MFEFLWLIVRSYSAGTDSSLPKILISCESFKLFGWKFPKQNNED